MSPEERIRMLLDENAALRARLYDKPVDIGELDMSGVSSPQPVVPDIDQINATVYETNANPFHYGTAPKYSLSPPKQASKNDKIAAALQKRRQILGRP